MSQPFALHCLGQPRLVAPDGRPVRLKTRKHLALLVYLAVEPRVPQRRDRLTTLLWEKAPASDARHSLATALSVLRAKLGRDKVEGGRDWVRLRAPDLDLDLDRLARGEVLPTDLMPALDVGGFLEDFDIPDAQAFSHWCDGQRARWQPRIGDALASLMDRCRRTGDFNQIEHYADRMLQLNELNEAGIRAKMEARAFAGDRLSALKVYEAWRLRLAEELDAEPSPLLEGIAVRLRHRGLERQNTSEIAPVPTDQWKDRPFVGRAPEYRRLYEAWESSRACQPCHYLVLGDSGVGKSTVLHRLATAAGLEGAVPVRAQGHALEQKIPYAAIGTLVEDLIDRPGASCTEPAALADLAQIVTRVGDRFPDLPKAPAMQGEATRIRLAESVERLLVSVAEEQPVVLVVDDLHHADDASIAVLHLLMRRLTGSPVMILAAARVADLAEMPSGRRLTEAGDRIRLQSLELGPLSGSESEALIDTLIPPGEALPSGTARQAVLRAGAGFPMALELLVHDWRAHGDQCLALSLDAMTEDVAVGDMPSHTYRQSFQRIYRQLDPLTKNVLNLAAVLGARLHDPRMYGLADLSLGQMMTGLTQLTSLRVLRDGGRQLEFINELIRSEAYLAIPSPLRRVLHGGIAERLVGDDREGRDVPGLEIAWHLIRAGRGSKATPYLLNGAQVAMRHGAPNEAERALSSAMEHLEEPARSEAVILLAESLQEQGKLRESLRVLEEGSHLHARVLMLYSEVLRIDAVRHLTARQTSEEGWIRTLIKLSGRMERSAYKVRALSVAASCFERQDNPELAHSLRQALRKLEHVSLEGFDRILQRYALATLSYYTNDTQDCFQHLEKAIEDMGGEFCPSSLECMLANGLAASHCSTGRFTDAIPWLERAWESTKRISNITRMPAIATNMAYCHFALGQFEQQITWATAALDSLELPVNTPVVARSSYLAALGYALLSQTENIHKILANASHAIHATNELSLRQEWMLMEADILGILRQDKNALAVAEQALSLTKLGHSRTRRVGRYARWVAKVGLAKADRSTTKTLDLLFEKRQTLDRTDQTEVSIARTWVNTVTGRHDPEATSQTIREAARLPSGFRSVADMLGMLDFGQLGSVPSNQDGSN